MRYLALPVLLLSTALAPAHQEPAKGAATGELLTLDRIFASSDFHEQTYGPVHWLSRQGGYAILAPSAQVKGDQDIVRIDPATGKQSVLVSAAHLVPAGETKPLTIEEFQFSGDESHVLIYTNTRRVWRKNTRGDYYVLDVNGRDLRKLGGDAKSATLMFASFSPDGSKVAYVMDRNIHVEDVVTHKIRQLTAADSDDIINGTFDWVYEEEFGLYSGFRWSPDSKKIAFWQLDTTGMDDYFLVNNVAGLYQQLTKFKYPKVGRPNAACRIGVATVDDGDITWPKVPGNPRDHYIPWMDWADNSEEIVLQQLNRLQNTNNLMLATLGGKISTILVERDQAWLDVDNNVAWHSKGQKLTWTSERDGWKRVYGVTRTGESIQPITPLGMDVIDVAGIDEQAGWLYYSASPDNATQKYLYRVQLDGSKAQRVTPAAAKGTHEYQMSPDHRWAIHTFSALGTPPVVELVSLPDHKVVRTLEDNSKLKEKLQALKRGSSEFFRITIGGGVELDGWCLKPPQFDPAKRYPVLFHVYGEPAAQNVLDHWGGGSVATTYLWHQYLTQLGYVVISVDNRGTPSPRGREWRKVVYRQVGILGRSEQAAAVKALEKKWSFLDPARIGIWGWSGGGTSSLNAIFGYPDLYHTAMAVAPVGNQRYYDSIYQERYMSLPEDNVAGYRDGSPLTHAHKLKGNLLIVHGTGDDNVHYANTEAVIDELIAHNKQFDMMAYPNRTHAINEGSNTRRHLFTLLTRYLHQHLPAEGKNKGGGS